jgi:sugar phosphate permease
MDLLKLLTVVGALCIVFVGLFLVAARMKAKQQGFGPNSLRAIGIIIFVPTLLILAVVTDFKTETLAALLGAVAGYVLSYSKPEDI